MELDTGNLGPIAIGKPIAGLLGLKRAVTTAQAAHFKLSGGEIVQGPARVGNFIMDGDIGANFLRKWDVTLDLATSRAWLRPASA